MKKPTRREFVSTAAKATSLAALATMFPPSARAQQTCAKETLQKIGEISSNGKGVLKGVLKIKNTRKKLPGYAGSQLPMMRYFEGYSQLDSKGVWPPQSLRDRCMPGPTLRVSVGERVELTFLNQTDVGQFPGLTFDNAETGATDGCDKTTANLVDQDKKPLPPDKNWYPGTRGDSFPNCFHASSSANLHFHGTHITPDAFGDNVLVQVRPNPKITETEVGPIFDKLFNQCREHGEHPMAWKHVEPDYVKMQEAAVLDYDRTAIWQGKRGDGTTSVLPVANQLTPANTRLTDQGLWPQFFIGAYPNCFTLTRPEGHEMGQSPGTHWYHAHKHGSTSVNLYNGLAGVLLIEGEYDRALEKIYPNFKENERVLIVQVFTDLPNLERASGGKRVTLTNGQPLTGDDAATIVMRPGQVSLWRIVNATVQATINASFKANTAGATLPAFRQIAQDGVQFKLENYKAQPLTSPDKTTGNGTKFTLGPGNRIDILVQAPALPSGATSASYTLSGIANLTVCGTPVTGEDFPTDKQYPEFPPYLHDVVVPAKPPRELSFDWEPYRIATGPAAEGSTHVGKFPLKVPVGHKEITIETNRAPYFMIDNMQFEDLEYSQTMMLGHSEEWIVYNTTSVAHPFHIHINPFQVVEVFDPNNAAASYKREVDGVWQDVLLVPGAKLDANRNLVIDPATGRPPAANRGYVRFRSRFVDFAGSFVLHCHILAHEDRGMMQLVRVIDNKAPFRHH